jgi:tetratricopeptide (TPR) repeat protein
MRRTSTFHLLTGCGLIALLTACSSKEPGTETGARNISDSTMASATDPSSGPVAVTTASEEARALYAQGRERADQLRAHDAHELFKQAAAKDPKFALAQYELALNSPTTVAFQGHLDQAVALSSQASEGERLMIQALQARSNGDSKQSLAFTEELVARYPRDARAHALLATGYVGQRNYDQAVTQLTQALEAKPDYAPAYNQLGYAYLPQGKYAEAEEAFKKYIELVPNDPNPYDSYAEMLMQTGRFDESIAQYRKALTLDPHFSNSFIGIASNLMFQGKHAAAAAQAQKLYDLARNDGDRRTALQSRAVTFVDQGRTTQALQETEKLYALDAKIGDTAAMSADARQAGDVLLGSGQADAAGKRYTQSLALVRDSRLSAEAKENATLVSHYDIARVALAKRDLPTARAAAEKYVSGVEATHDAARIRLGHELAGAVALEEKDYDKAGAELAQADQRDAYVLNTTAMAFQGKGDAGKAEELIKLAAGTYTFPTIRSALVRAKATKLQ